VGSDTYVHSSMALAYFLQDSCSKSNIAVAIATMETVAGAKTVRIQEVCLDKQRSLAASIGMGCSCGMVRRTVRWLSPDRLRRARVIRTVAVI
jgi:hypothetical protein